MKLGEIAVFTSNVPEMMAYYRALFGREPLWESEGGGQFEIDGVKVLVHARSPAEPGMPPNESHFALVVPDVDGTVVGLRDRGLAVIAGPEDYDWGRAAYLRDPDGHLVEITEG